MLPAATSARARQHCAVNAAGFGRYPIQSFSRLRTLVACHLPPPAVTKPPSHGRNILATMPSTSVMVACERPRPRVSTSSLTGYRAGDRCSRLSRGHRVSGDVSDILTHPLQTGRLALAADRGTSQRLVEAMAPLVPHLMTVT